MVNKIFAWSLGLVPISLAAHFLGSSEILVFFLAALAIIPLAKFLGDATEELASHSGAALGGLLNATFGNATELIIAFFALKAGLIEVVKASITGSIIGNLLFVLGMSIFIGGLRHKKQSFNQTAAMANASMLILAVIALVIPTVFLLTSPGLKPETIDNLSVTVAALMFITYIASLIFIFRTHPHLYTEEVGKLKINWSVKQAVVVLTVATVAIAVLSEILVGAIKPTVEGLGWTELFIGAVVIAIIGNAAEHTSAIVMAVKNRMDLSLQIAIGSATQIAMLLVPLLVFAGLMLGQDMDLVFNNFELGAIVLSIVITNLVVQDGESNWLEGVQLLAAYGIIAGAFFLHP